MDDPQVVLAILAQAVRELLEDKELAYSNPGERAVVNRLGQLLQGRYEGWRLDIEWDRREDKIKKLPHSLDDDTLVALGAIVPDLIVHRVGKRENLLVVEVKRSINRDFEGDIWKLRGMTQQQGDYGYLVGVHLVIDCQARALERCDVFTDGETDPDLSDFLRAQFQ